MALLSTTATEQNPRFENRIDSESLFQIKNLELRVRMVMDGLWKGLHRSPLHGFSAEFTEYRAYTPGDDLRYLDWKLYGRSKRFYIKKFLEETNLRCFLLVDQTRSMSFTNGTVSKWDYASTLAGTWAYFLNLQRDATGLATFDTRISNYLPARSRFGHLRQILLALDKEPAAKTVDLAASLEEFTAILKKRSVVVVISDFLFPLDQLQKAFQTLTVLRNPVIAVQILDSRERTFGFESGTVFEDMETEEKVFVDPGLFKEKYQQKFQAHQKQLAEICQNSGANLISADTSTPLPTVMLQLIQTRALTSKAAQRRSG